jgi:hypothetical protein
MAAADRAESTTPANQRRVMDEDEEEMCMKKSPDDFAGPAGCGFGPLPVL